MFVKCCLKFWESCLNRNDYILLLDGCDIIFMIKIFMLCELKIKFFLSVLIYYILMVLINRIV